MDFFENMWPGSRHTLVTLNKNGELLYESKCDSRDAIFRLENSLANGCKMPDVDKDFIRLSVDAFQSVDKFLAKRCEEIFANQDIHIGDTVSFVNQGKPDRIRRMAKGIVLGRYLSVFIPYMSVEDDKYFKVCLLKKNGERSLEVFVNTRNVQKAE